MNAVSLFSGAGGLDLGLRQAGFDIILALDNEPLTAQSHGANFPGTPFHLGSVKELDAELAADLTEGKTREGVDLLAGGPPCPPFSKSRFYRKEKPRALEDPVGFETMRGYLDTLHFLRPRAFLLENVGGLAYDVHNEALQLILQTAHDLGYQTTHRILNAADYGVPQKRQRLFIVGTQEGDFQWPAPTHAEEPSADLFSGGRQPWRTAGDAIGDLDTEENADDAGHFAGGKYHELLKEIPPGDNYLFFTEKRGHPNPQFEWRSRYWSFLLKLSPDHPSWTIQARRSNNMGPLHWRNRILRIEEVKRLQTFPDDWSLAGTVEQQWRQVGNAVPPLLARHLGAALRDVLAHETGEVPEQKRAVG